MDATFIQDGSALDYTPSGSVAAGDVIVQDQLVCVAKSPIAANVLGSICPVGVYDFPKAAGSSTAFVVGAKAYWDVSEEVMTIDPSGNIYAGKAVAVADDDAETVRVRLDQ